MGRRGPQWEQGRRGSPSAAGGMARARGSAAKARPGERGRPYGDWLAPEYLLALCGGTGRELAGHLLQRLS